jgi:hypothetical protein
MRQSSSSRFCVEVREPQESLPGQQKLDSRFCVEVPRASVGVDWQLNSTTTDSVFSMTKHAVFGSNIRLYVVKWDGVERPTRTPEEYKIKKMKGAYDQICGKLRDSWKSVDLCTYTDSDHDDVVVCSISNANGKIEFDAECAKAIANVEAEIPKKKFYLCVRIIDPKLVEQRERRDRENEFLRILGNEMTRLNRYTREDLELKSSRMTSDEKETYFQEFRVQTPFDLAYRGYVNHALHGQR